MVIHAFVPLTTIQVLKYTLFQPGLFLNYFTYPHRSSEHLNLIEVQIDFQNNRAIVLGDGEDQLSLTTVAAAIYYEGEWPEVGGVRGGQITASDLIQLGEEIRGR
jgi:hypothetical protein